MSFEKWKKRCGKMVREEVWLNGDFISWADAKLTQ